MSIFILYSYVSKMQLQQTEQGNRANLFVLNMVIVYAVWKAFWYYTRHSTGFVHIIWDKIIFFLGAAYASVTSMLLNTLGEQTLHNGIDVLYPQLNKTITVADHCLAIPATVIFTGTIVLFKGNWRYKLWFIPMGILFIILINLARLVMLCYLFAHYTRPFYDINHSMVYVIITYALIFLLIVWWMRKFADRKWGNDMRSL